MTVTFGRAKMPIKLYEITLTKAVTNKFSHIKQRTGITPNLMGRVAFLKALEANPILDELKFIDDPGQKIPKDIFFGEDEELMALGFELYLNTHARDIDQRKLLNALVDFGAQQIPLVKSIDYLESVLGS